MKIVGKIGFVGLLLSCATAGLAQTTAGAAMLSASNPRAIASLLQDMGYRASLSKGSDGDPVIDTAMSGYSAKIFFMNCKSGAQCEDVQFFVGVETSKKLSLQQVNTFNAAKRFVRLYLDKDQDPLMELDLSMIEPGISVAAFRDTVAVFEQQVGNLANLIDSVR